MSKQFSLTVLRILDREDPETFSFVFNFKDASRILSPEQLRERVYTDESNKELKAKLLKFSSSPVFFDFVKANQDKVWFEVYPAELFAATHEGTNLTISHD